MKKGDLFMKKFLVLMLSIFLVMSLMVGCTSTSEDTSGTDNPPAVEDNKEETNDKVKVGLGTINSIAKSKSYSLEGSKETLPVGQVDTIMAAAAFDADGKVISVIIDTAQTKVNFDKELKLTSDKAAEIKTKFEKGDEYGMRKASPIQKEWFEQIAELEKWMVGKTIDEITGMQLKDDAPDVPELTSTVTMGVDGYIAAVEKAYANAIEVENFEKLGLGQNVSIAKSKELGEKDGKEVLPVAQVDTTIAATAFDADGKVVGTSIDVAQVKINFDAEGQVTTDQAEAIKTKKEKGEDYGMRKASPIKKEWFEQIADLENWMVGKTTDEIKGMQLKDEAPDVPELTSSVTIGVTSYIEAVVESFANAR
ncbi:Tfp pilus assembly PilM family ATPase [Alkaliphilus hydrothermalis]|uniref:Tfp pilus assembly PilM family ATPase n=1 Tax=Alkaliphilus hydrothermalis TaxID=1482730 RepID=A0ABS2NTC1_9FIRM|nr:Tfp pilus assembly PilM family ATPase [Alkaliphilus hydrothermalis]